MQADFSVELGRDDPVLEIPWSSGDPSVRYYDLKNCPELVLKIPEAVAYPEISILLTRINAPGFPLATAKCDAWHSREISPEEEVFGADRKFVSYVDLFFVDEAYRCSFEKNETLAKELCRLLRSVPDIAATIELIIRRCYCHRLHVSSPGHAAQVDAVAFGATAFGMTANHKVFSPEEPVLEITCNARQTTDDPPDAIEEPGKVAGTLRQSPADKIHLLDDPDITVSGFCLTAYVSGFGDSDHDPRGRWEIAFALLQHALIQSSRI
jgi:hypothetical protein